jgi:hypothetical protein
MRINVIPTVALALLPVLASCLALPRLSTDILANSVVEQLAPPYKTHEAYKQDVQQKMCTILKKVEEQFGSKEEFDAAASAAVEESAPLPALDDEARELAAEILSGAKNDMGENERGLVGMWKMAEKIIWDISYKAPPASNYDSETGSW